ncbi:hypothetical protein [Hyphobacterium sp.]|uniref:hypothetical protein n=1 Tax=Hyphobacterium sp. TaxID=2004662 RepID=UPI0037481219
MLALFIILAALQESDGNYADVRRIMVEATVDVDYQPEFPALDNGHNTTVLIDRYHDTIYRIDGIASGTSTLLEILAADGFQTAYLDQAISAERLAESDVLFIHGLPNEEVQLPNGGTFWRSPLAAGEIDSVVRWVDGGGGLFLSLSHFPNGSGALPLLEAFSVRFRDGYIYSDSYPSFTDPVNGHCSHYFGLSSQDHTLNTDHPLLQDGLPVSRVDLHCGAGVFREAEDVVLGFPAGSINYDATGQISETSDFYAGMIAFNYGAGRVVIATDQGLFRDFIFEFDSGDQVFVTITGPENDNANLFVNTVRWLSPNLR